MDQSASPYDIFVTHPWRHSTRTLSRRRSAKIACWLGLIAGIPPSLSGRPKPPASFANFVQCREIGIVELDGGCRHIVFDMLDLACAWNGQNNRRALQHLGQDDLASGSLILVHDDLEFDTGRFKIVTVDRAPGNKADAIGLAEF